MSDLWTDGGCLGKNPSPFGGTWAWIRVEAGKQLAADSGVVTADEIGLPKVTNNLTELLAIIQGLDGMPDGWDGIIYTDSEVSQIRLNYPHAKMNGIPDFMQEQLAKQRQRLGRLTARLVAGHPSARDLRAGSKKGLPVSAWNKKCDEACQRLAKAWFEAKAIREFEERHQLKA